MGKNVREHEREGTIMDPRQFARQIIQFNKTTFDNTFDSMTVLQEQTEKLMLAWMKQNPFMPREASQSVRDWLKSYKKACADYKAAVDESFKRTEEWF